MKTKTNTETTPTIVVPTVDLTQYNPLDEKIKEMEELNKNLVFNYEDLKDNKNARSHRAKLRSMRADVGRVHKELKESVLVIGREIDKVKKKYEARVTAMIEVHDKPLKAIEQRETDRVARLQGFKDTLIELGDSDGLDSLEYAMNIDKVKKIDVGALELGEDYKEAVYLQGQAIADMEKQLVALEEQEEKDAELARLQAEEAERKRKAEVEAEAQRLAQQQTEDAQRREAEAEARAKRAEEDKQREINRLKEEQRIKEEQRQLAVRREEAERKERENDKAAIKFTLKLIVDDLVKKCELSNEQATKVADCMMVGLISNVRVEVSDPVDSL